MVLNNLINYLNERFPLSLAESWDNSGSQLVDESREVKKIVLTIDVTDKAVEYAIENNADMILSHHPFIFSPLKNLELNTYRGGIIKKLIVNDISCYSMHTNYDSGKDGMNTIVAGMLELSNCRNLVETDAEMEAGFGMVGELENAEEIDDFVESVKSTFKLDYVIEYVFNKENKIKKVAFCGGAGSEFIAEASSLNADIYLTGDIKHHDAQLAYELGLNLLDVSHYGLEKVFVDHMEKVISHKFPDIELLKYNSNDFSGRIK
ncbi:dinuclear metal center protein, YbgI/SA1388 family [Dethiosulfatibacter aminovorans DSM 17477]|uniref:GTP cyclohydrolase 1 type 2 homolog n=1 Tax=Dethiosulfatibacter aminovorans DSM 17477 TaxID=1121476 RepID=A0A1M6DRX2_9FIRM|nr:Nif3-like dinuclear metal center hexameric protein [Dethiosulfatibacter aminovorans]SHI76006.1 dinuclear metal center protein, YbgI/SA1388 family [Dethiosulfatibacter aminovorans DSM 17477]